MKIYQITNKKEYLSLLLLADEQESMIDKYIDNSTMYVLEDSGIKGEIVVCELQEKVLEIKNLAVLPTHHKQGYGRTLINFICNKYKNQFTKVIVGTGDSDYTIPFYEKCGFSKCFPIKNFFKDNYDHTIIENRKQLIDMIYLEKTLN